MKDITSQVAPNGCEFTFLWGKSQSVLAILDGEGELYHFFVLRKNVESEAVAVGRRWFMSKLLVV